MPLTLEAFTVNEGKSFFYRATLKDQVGANIELADIVSATLTLYDAETLSVINGRDDQDILNANDVTIGVINVQVNWEM